ncbi:MAG TPA: hypothetical protein VHX20_06225 [Terracidiphilus sp.]|jgi:hypothetical protein|nr:hypothetical protein [Terracidiphilus sp.]
MKREKIEELPASVEASHRVTVPIEYRYVYRQEVQEPEIPFGTEILYYRGESEHPLPFPPQAESDNTGNSGVGN